MVDGEIGEMKSCCDVVVFTTVRETRSVCGLRQAWRAFRQGLKPFVYMDEG